MGAPAELPTLLLGPLCSVLRTTLLTICNANRIKCAAHNMIANARQILYPAATDKHNGVLLEIVPNAGYIGGHFHAVREPDPCDFSESGVRLLRCRGINPDTDPSLLGAALQSRALGLGSCQ